MTNKQFDVLREDISVLRTEVREGLASIDEKVSSLDGRVWGHNEQISEIKVGQQTTRRLVAFGMAFVTLAVAAIELFWR